MDVSQVGRQRQDAVVGNLMYVAFELSEKNWKLALGDGMRGPSRYTVRAGDTDAVLAAIDKAKARCRMQGSVRVRSCYEAGRDGFWLHRWLAERDIDNLVVDSASIEINRRARRAKTDRLDSDKLLSMLMRYHAGERRIWSVTRVPTAQQEDERRTHRELERLRQERTAHGNRIRSLLVLNNLRVDRIGGPTWARWWKHQAARLLPGLRSEIDRELARLALVGQQISALEAQQRTLVRNGAEPGTALLARLTGIGVGSAWTLSKELFDVPQPSRARCLCRTDADSLCQRRQ